MSRLDNHFHFQSPPAAPQDGAVVGSSTQSRFVVVRVPDSDVNHNDDLRLGGRENLGADLMD